MKSVLVTVGTTEFDELIQTIIQDCVLKVLLNKGFSKVVLQVGKGKFKPPEGFVGGVKLEVFELKPSLIREINDADLIISHAGAGSCFEALRANKLLIAVVNDSLMHNHQVELAEELAKQKYCFFSYPSTLKEALIECDETKLQPFTRGNPHLFATYLDSVVVAD